MRLHHLRLVGITEAFPNEACVDFDSSDTERARYEAHFLRRRDV